MKLLVSGREGQLARSLVERAALFEGIEVLALGRPELDLEKPETIGPAIAAAAPDVVVNAAAYTAVDKAEDEPERTFRVNAEGAGALASAARAAGAAVIQVSTDYVFDGTSPVPYREGDPTDPIGVYGRSKLEGERLVGAATGDHLILRTAWVYSPFGHNFVKTMMRLARERDEVAVVSDQIGNPTSALDLATGILAVVDRWRRGESAGIGEAYHLAGTGTSSWYDFAAEIFRLCAEFGLPSARVRPIASKDWPTRARRPPRSWLDTDRFERDFGYRMPPWQASVRDVIERLKRTGY